MEKGKNRRIDKVVEQKERELVLKELAVDSVNGLSSHDVSERLELHGRNEFEIGSFFSCVPRDLML